jgi:hypothetical protein
VNPQGGGIHETERFPKQNLNGGMDENSSLPPLIFS